MFSHLIHPGDILRKYGANHIMKTKCAQSNNKVFIDDNKIR